MLSDGVIKILEQFDVHPDFGFVYPDPLVRLPEKFVPWHEIIGKCTGILPFFSLILLPELLEKGLLEDRIQKLPLIAADTLRIDKELRLAHLLLATLAAGHIWQYGPNKVQMSIPVNISSPLLDVSNRLGLKPIVCHASVCLANWKPLRNTPTFNAEHVDIIASRFLRHPANRWFFTLTAQIETELAPALCAIASACYHRKIEETTMQDIRNSLSKATHSIEASVHKLQLFKTNCCRLSATSPYLCTRHTFDVCFNEFVSQIFSQILHDFT
ncbi:unnamed protein product [Gongylonema pulchrum]|uniref:Elp3 domain-containing protein n=1 Tax=Gongylonema pulchrum TaxID=637853 RepID=A0A183EG55_9BILA|nr:unnamed protein product [Gongylonema pulchrum]